MILNKEMNKATSVVYGELENQHDWQSADGIYVNRTYSLIYTNDLVPNKMAIKKFGGFYIQNCLANLFSDFAGSWDDIQCFRREFLSAVIEVWGNAEMYNKGHKHPAKDVVRLVKKAAMSRKHKETVDLALGMYIAAHFNELKESDLAIHVQDTHTELIISEKEYLQHGSKHMTSVVSYDQFRTNSKAMGYFSIHYPTAEEVERLISPH